MTVGHKYDGFGVCVERVVPHKRLFWFSSPPYTSIRISFYIGHRPLEGETWAITNRLKLFCDAAHAASLMDGDRVRQMIFWTLDDNIASLMENVAGLVRAELLDAGSLAHVA